MLKCKGNIVNVLQVQKRRNKITNTFTTKKEYFTPDYATHISHKTG